jgi:hypothetical protein
MGFRLDPSDDVRRQVRMLLGAECAAARRAARATDDAAVHAIRRHGRRSRALLRLARHTLHERDFTRLNHAWRDIGRLLAPLRDHCALCTCLTAIRQRYPERLAQLEVPRPAEPGARARAFRKVRTSLARLWRRLRDLECRGGWRRVIAGHMRTLAACAEAQEHLGAGDHAERRHEWRKRVKDARHQTHLLARLGPGVLIHLETAWDRLGDALGREQDVVLTCRWLAARRDQAAAAFLQAGMCWLRHLRGRTAHTARGLPPHRRTLRHLLKGGRRKPA